VSIFLGRFRDFSVSEAIFEDDKQRMIRTSIRAKAFLLRPLPRDLALKGNFQDAEVTCPWDFGPRKM
jgi:hypothetical protein